MFSTTLGAHTQAGHGGVMVSACLVSSWPSKPHTVVRLHTQVFVANPNKTPAIVTILVSNRDKLLKYLGDFHTDKGAPAPANVHVWHVPLYEKKNVHKFAYLSSANTPLP